MQFQSITGWNDHILAGRKYLNTATKGLKRPTVFNNELIFQLAAMGIEKLIVGVSQYHRQMPVDHTLSGLVEGLAAVCPMDAELVDRIKGVESIDDMCALTVAHRQPPGDAEIEETLAVGNAVVRFVDGHLPSS
jgi:hypothetical protein